MVSHRLLWSWCLCIFLILPFSAVCHEDVVKYLHRAQRPGHWLVGNQSYRQAWLRKTAQHVEASPKDLHPAVAELRNLIENDAQLYLLASGMYQDIPDNYSDPSGRTVHSYTQMLQVMNHLLTTAPVWSEHENQIGLVGLPIHALMDWPMGTFYGFAFFLDSQVNAILKQILNVWGDFLRSPTSAHVLDRSATGWFGPTALQALTATANVDGSSYSFEELFVCDPAVENHGFASWDAFFTRKFHEDKRPVAAPDEDSVIANVCESLPFALAYDVKQRDQFWVKGQAYSVQDMLGLNELSEQFVGGTIYQAYLSSISYHRWHAPVSGTVVKVVQIDGTYYSEPLFEILDTYGAVPRAPRYAQGYLSVVATRAVIYIQADNPHIGLVALVEVGMSEVSSCEVTVEEGQVVKKGEEIGMFHFGGSTWCLLFRKGVKVSGFPRPGERTDNVPVRSQLAVVEPPHAPLKTDD